MQTKKSKDANLENKKFVFFTVGLVMVSSLVLMAFKYETADVDEKVVQDLNPVMEEEYVFELPPEEEVIEEEPETAPPPPVIIDDVVVVDDEEDVDDFDFSDIDDEDPCLDCDDDDDDDIEEEEIVPFAEIEPSFPGGEKAMAEFIRDNIKISDMDSEIGTGGTIYVQFVVNKNGSIEQTTIARGISDGLDKSAIDVVNKMPRWVAGEQAGKKVRCRFTLPIQIDFGRGR
jgi:protein TonB